MIFFNIPSVGHLKPDTFFGNDDHYGFISTLFSKKYDTKKIKVDLKLIEKTLIIEFFDEGIKVDPSKVKPRKLEEIRPGGLGTHFIKMVMDDIQWGESRNNWINHLTLKKKI